MIESLITPMSKERSELSRSSSTKCQNPGVTPSSPIPRVQQTLQRSISRKDASPLLITEVQESSKEDCITCLICNKHEARYSCPKCRVPYCSVDCYKVHDAQDGGGPCTEAFYQERVSSMLNLEKKSTPSMESIINRSYQQQRSMPEEEVVSQDELYELAAALKHSTMDDDRLVDSLLTPTLKSAFEEAVRNGNMSHVVEPWHPWWIPQLVGADQDPTREQTLAKKSLDERLLAIPPFSSLHVSPSPTLPFNLIELLYNISLTLRMYNGAKNAKVLACPDAAYSLLTKSKVLHDNARYNTAAEALVSCTTITTANPNQQQVSERNAHQYDIHWTTLVEDVALLCDDAQRHQWRRYVGRAILEAVDMVKDAIKCVKKQGGETTLLKKGRKKLEFYLSWTQQAQEPHDLSLQIREWKNDWSYSDNANEMETLRLPNGSSASNKQSSAMSKTTTPSNDNSHGVAKGEEESPILMQVKSTRRFKDTA